MRIKELVKKKPKQGAGALIYNREDDKYLFILRSDKVNSPLTWAIPGGSVDPGEHHKAAAIREIQEEVGYDVSDCPMELMCVNRDFWPRFEFFNYAIIVPKRFTPVLNWESEDSVWCDLDNIPEPKHWGLNMLLSNDRAADRLKKFLDNH